MKLHIFGSRSGTEPMPNRFHTAWALEINGELHWFDAGEGCEHIAHNKGLDLLKIRNLFISHPHIDHVGGLAMLLWTIHKICGRKEVSPEHFNIHAFLPERSFFDATIEYLKSLNENIEQYYSITPELIGRDRILLDTPELKVECQHNLHLPPNENGSFRSYSYRIFANGKTTVFSGDLKSVDELGKWLDNCDLLLMETGHHKASQVCSRLRELDCSVKEIIFIHHGREILNDYQGAKERAEIAWGKHILIAEDGMTLDL